MSLETERDKIFDQPKTKEGEQRIAEALFQRTQLIRAGLEEIAQESMD